MSQEATSLPARTKRIELTNLITLLALVINIGVVVSYATSIQSSLDAARNIATTNCQLLKSAIVLSVEQSKGPTFKDRQIATQIENNFNKIGCLGR